MLLEENSDISQWVVNKKMFREHNFCEPTQRAFLRLIVDELGIEEIRNFEYKAHVVVVELNGGNEGRMQIKV